jgi:rfaE bifunctional protein kinase chain/domain
MELTAASAPPRERLARLVARLPGHGVVVWGDFVLDEYWRCLTRRVSREAPVMVLEYQDRQVQAGGAANTALNLAALGAHVRVVGWGGADAAGHELRRLLEDAGVDTDGLLEHDHASTVVKTRVVAGSVHTALQQVLRVDRGARFPLAAGARARVIATVRRAADDAHAVVLSDYGYDAVTPALATPLVRAWRRRGRVISVDARHRLAAYRGVTLATPNESEAAEAAAIEIESVADLERAASRLQRSTRVDHLLITRGRDGLTLWDGRRGRNLEAWGGREAVDVTGAGDAVVATATLALAAGAQPLDAAALANVAGSIAVSRRGAVAVGWPALHAALGRRNRRVRRRRARR